MSVLPRTLIHLTFETKFNQKIPTLPLNITNLTLGLEFEQQYDIPSNIKYLKLNSNNQYIINYLPNSIAELELELGEYFDLQIENLPTSIKKLIIDKKSVYNLDLNCLPDFIEELHLNRFYKKRISRIPSNLKKLICDKKYPHKNDFRMCIIETYL